ncbi:MAG: pilus assembly protein [Syntrophales bacterium]|jgi:Flp pilus assembly protein TadG|nr:pilus assembly protein [Syntrophales bacterium]MDY0044754.1 TadE/TadG family type IV pilus assembly protein [Syntrophales bacterium]
MEKKLCMNVKGIVAIEFAIVLPVLALLICGIIEFSVLLYDKAMITNASREGARRGIVYNYDTVNDVNHPIDSEIESAVLTYCQDRLITFGGDSELATTISRTGDETGDDLTVRVTYHYDYLLIPGFIAQLAGGIDLVAQTVMRME